MQPKMANWLKIKQLVEKHIKDRKVYSYQLESKTIYCNACLKSIKLNPTSVLSSINSHDNGERHKLQLLEWDKRKLKQQSTIELLNDDRDTFTKDLTKMLIGADIPFAKLSNDNFRNFIKKYCFKQCPHESNIRKNHLIPTYESIMNGVTKELVGRKIYVQIDEAIILHRRFVSILAGRLDGKEPKSFCISVIEIKQAPNGYILKQALLEAMKILYPDRTLYEDLELVVTDQASYMLKAMRELKAIFPNMMHITCLCHALHRVCEEAKVEYSQAAALITSLKMVLSKSSRRVDILECGINGTMRKLPIDTRWGTWIRFAGFVYDNLNEIIQFASRVEDDDGIVTKKLKENISKPNSREQLGEIRCLLPLTGVIEQLESRRLTIFEVKELIDEQIRQLPEIFKDKLMRSLWNNPDYGQIFSHPKAYNSLLRAPLVSCDVERSFSMMKNILRDRRSRMTEETFTMYATINYNLNAGVRG